MVPGKATVTITVSVKVGSPVCRFRARMYAAPIPLVTWITAGIVDPVPPAKAIVTITVNVKAAWSVFRSPVPILANSRNTIHWSFTAKVMTTMSCRKRCF